MPRPNIGRERIMFRDKPELFDAEAEIESAERGREVSRSEMVRILSHEALKARARRRRLRARRAETPGPS